MDIASEVSISETKKLTLFNKTPRMSTYIICFAVGDFQFIETSSFRIPIRVISTTDTNIEQGRRALNLAVRTMETFEKIFDVPYPLPKLDLIAISNNQGAMENWGLITFIESRLLVDEKKSSADAWRSAARTIVHEIAHQWFGNIV
jgi:aminopeptidase 2